MHLGSPFKNDACVVWLAENLHTHSLSTMTTVVRFFEVSIMNKAGWRVKEDFICIDLNNYSMSQGQRFKGQFRSFLKPGFFAGSLK